MENSSFTENTSTENTSKPSSWLLISLIIAAIVGVSLWLYLDEKQEAVLVVDSITVEGIVESEAPEIHVKEIKAEVEIITDTVEEPPVVELIEKNPLPLLDESDNWLKEKLPSLTWRKELLKLVIDDDMIRRFVVFTDNFSQGILAYKHRPLVLPSSSFSAIETQVFDDKNQQEWLWDSQSEKRFSLYIDLLKSIDGDSVIRWYHEVKPLIDQAYAELGYPDDDFTDTLQDAITRVLDAELPKYPLKIIRPSVMFKYQDSEIEALDDVDKFLLRLGKENLLVVKSALLEFSEKLNQEPVTEE